MQQLEAETQALRTELAALRQQQPQSQPPMRLPDVAPLPVDGEGDSATVPASALLAEEQPGVSLDSVRGEIKKFTWTKGDFKITPYGSLWTDMVYETARTYPGPYTFWSLSSQTGGEPAFFVDARRTRLGLDVAGPRIPFFNCAQSSGRVEIDFEGDATLENRATLLLRHAYWQVKNEDYCVLVGQTWDVTSPLYPGMLNYLPANFAGNLGYRRAQFRLERYLEVSPELLITVQSSLNQNIVPDLTTAAGVSRESGSWPTLEGRVAAKLGPRGPDCLPVEFGVSSHIGETGFDLPIYDDYRRRTWSLNADLAIPITYRLKFQAEVFSGSNLSPLLGGIGQGISPVTYNAIRSNGGWFDFRYDWTSRLHSCAGWSLDDPDNNDLAYGKTYNEVLFTNVTFDITKKFLTGVEFSYWKTGYKGAGTLAQPDEPGRSAVIDWMVVYSF